MSQAAAGQVFISR